MIRFYCLIELTPNESHNSYDGADTDDIKRVVVSDICQMVCLSLWSVESAMLKSFFDELPEITLLTPVYDEQSHYINLNIPEALIILIRNWIGAILQYVTVAFTGLI